VDGILETSHREANRSFRETKRDDQRQQIEFSRRVGVRGGTVCALGMRDPTFSVPRVIPELDSEEG
jgi:hypothetical protein